MLTNGASFSKQTDYDGGITGCQKLVTSSEGLGVDWKYMLVDQL